MYNNNKAEKPFNQSEILQPVHDCLRELLEREKKGVSTTIEFTDDDIIAVTLLYAHVLGNRYTHFLTAERAPIGLASELGKHYAVLITEITKGMSQVDTSNYYRGRQKDK